MFSVSEEQKLQVDACNLENFHTVMDACEDITVSLRSIKSSILLFHILQSWYYD